MKAKYFLLMVVVTLVAMLFIEDLSQTTIIYESNLVYAIGTDPSGPPDHEAVPPPDPKHSGFGRQDKPRTSVPEPTFLALIGTGIIGAGVYLFLRNRGKKK